MGSISLQKIPTMVDVLVIGGGPAGSYTATCLAKEGVNVLLLEKDTFPRYHIGESLLPSMRFFLRFVDLENKFVQHGFHEKPGAAFQFGKDRSEGYTDFVAFDENNFSWNVDRSQMDDMLFQHAKTSGAIVFDRIKVISLDFKDHRPISASWINKCGESGAVSFKYLVDASGRCGLLANSYLHDRYFNQSLKNVAYWAYWDGTGSYKPNTSRSGAPFFEALSDGSGWAWFIPLKEKTSIGIVMNQQLATFKKATMSSDHHPIEFYLRELQRAPAILSLIDKGIVIAKDGIPVVRFACDYSYSASSYAGVGYRIVGDAGAFIDPFFSNGVHLAISGGLSAAATICASFKGECPEDEAAKWHTARIGTSYTRFLVVVMSAYQQMRAQNKPILADIDEDNFDRAFDIFRPIIQGLSDISDQSSTKRLTEKELMTTLEFCSSAYMPPTKDTQASTKIQLVQFLGGSETIEALASTNISGRRMNVVQGALGLVPVD